MANETARHSSSDSTPTDRLKTTRDTLRLVISTVNNRRSPNQADLDAMLAATREIQRLADNLVSELVSLTALSPSSPPPETLLAANGAIPRNQVATEIDRARINNTFPHIAEQRRTGAAHTANIDVLARLTRTLDDDEMTVMRNHDAALADAAGRLSEDSFRKRVTRLRNKIRSDGGTTAAQQIVDDSYATVTPTTQRDAYRINGLLDPLRGAAVKAALARETSYLSDHPELCTGTTPAQVAAQALHDLILRGDSVDRITLPRASVQIHVLSDRDTLRHGPHEGSIAETFDSLPIGSAALGRLCCEATLRRIDTAPDAEVNVSRSARSPSQAQRAALRALYPHCPISGAGWESIEIHHVIYYETSRRTVLSELVPISRRWHHVWPAATPSCSLRSQHRSHHRHVSHPDGTPFCTIAPPVPVNQAAHDLAA